MCVNLYDITCIFFDNYFRDVTSKVLLSAYANFSPANYALHDARSGIKNDVNIRKKAS